MISSAAHHHLVQLRLDRERANKVQLVLVLQLRDTAQDQLILSAALVHQVPVQLLTDRALAWRRRHALRKVELLFLAIVPGTPVINAASLATFLRQVQPKEWM